MNFQQVLSDADATVNLGNQLAKAIEKSSVIHLIGDLGAGKTTLSRGIIQGLGFVGNVKSPTYTLVEPYELTDVQIYHFDLYRLADPEELEFMGIRDYFNNGSILLIEWPEKAGDLLPDADLLINMQYENDQRSANIQAYTELGRRILQKLS
ncbi:tRNA (adenosine(37)-N6)-threonylcarbamoyltransferase complex ATPase subunit type 1 TsaE [Catenovulum maritimum]|uniref:tRNA threonylcarbamoyladenosine biosynthesis protein TsaE n=1 Tax=Catenovulum maritimum TaxID=1513271 RepID=A0A0J8GSZ1_9ALTE|nr:tRNA (adenosine(37)-N6)-threonylcarbamoyltransferase complex ATPase subunit type 1 TsaE [Catenovulum maritimum]KMT64409.1 hypothetical protein XM47_14625 [Catenovulum maritimum]